MGTCIAVVGTPSLSPLTASLPPIISNLLSASTLGMWKCGNIPFLKLNQSNQSPFVYKAWHHHQLYLKSLKSEHNLNAVQFYCVSISVVCCALMQGVRAFFICNFRRELLYFESIAEHKILLCFILLNNIKIKRRRGAVIISTFFLFLKTSKNLRKISLKLYQWLVWVCNEVLIWLNVMCM